MTQTVDPWSNDGIRSASKSTNIAMTTTAQSQRRIATSQADLHGRGCSPAAGVTTAHRSPAGGRIPLPFCVLTWAPGLPGVRWGKAQMRGPVSRETLMDHSISAVH